MTVYIGDETCKTRRGWLLPCLVDQRLQVSGGEEGGCGEVRGDVKIPFL